MAITRILVVDDDLEVRKMLISVLQNEGYFVEDAENGKEAIKTCEKWLFDVALIDVELPDMKGTDLLQRLKEIQPKIIRIIITGHPSFESAVKAVNERAEGYVIKPFNVEVLLETIRKLLRERLSNYLTVFGEVTRAREIAAAIKHQNPNKSQSPPSTR